MKTRKETAPRGSNLEYSLSDLGKSFIPVLEHMKKWGEENLKDGEED